MTQENHRNSMRLLQHETWYYNGSRVLSVTDCTVGACTNNTPVHDVTREKKEKKKKTGNKADNKHGTLLVGIPCGQWHHSSI